MRRILLAVLFCSAAAVPGSADDRSLHLAVGDAARRDCDVPLMLDTITDARSGELLTPAELGLRLADARVLLVGESHTEDEFHRVQLRVLEELHAAGRRVTVGLEMFPSAAQPVLDRWTSGELDEAGFLEASHWYESWGYPFAYYRELFLFAQRNRLRMVGLNVPREVISTVRKKAPEELTDEERAQLPPIDLESAEHRQLFRAFFDEDDPIHTTFDEAAWEAMFRAQCAWDAVMARQVLAALPAALDPGSIVVVLVGSGHVAYHLGITRQARAQEYGGVIRALVPVPIESDDGVRRERIQASYADFLWGLPRELWPRYPSLGVATVPEEESPERCRVMWVGEDSAAEQAGFAVGDVVLEMNGVAVAGKEDLTRRLAALGWGDVVPFTVERGGEAEPVKLLAAFRRQPEEAEP